MHRRGLQNPGAGIRGREEEIDYNSSKRASGQFYDFWNICSTLLQHFSCHDKKIVDSLFGTNLHVELVGRSFEVLAFMATHGGLSLDDLDVIWLPVVQPNQHHSVREALWNLIERLVPYLSDDLRTHLASKVSQHLRRAGLSESHAVRILDACTNVAMHKGVQVCFCVH
ncbi:hypothetical protein M427DRAFT_220961 [Gonapodya prolifera JEL478]|uniref:Uncharacterized protein n=1 Tax=Gonapodya prolifera (strain JEL478) TaxID=1344416 RepID=A0A138ZYG1_GONPJ|nr:hypothetical protein M427DRAFT_220961 [Gonapodya prolifera JEL478]|eukprot:KXS09534.1 hypothetical protein M427DRAFT_220961 [Gonapodya prolifera JEL478]